MTDGDSSDPASRPPPDIGSGQRVSGTWFDRVWQPSIAFAGRILGRRNAAEAEDVVQEAAAEMIQHPGPVASEQHRRGRFFGFVRFLAYRRRRAAAVRRPPARASLSSALAEITGPTDPQVHAERRDDFRTVWEAIALLDEQSARIVVARARDGQPFAEIRDAEGLPSTAAARMRYRRAIQEISRRLSAGEA